MLFLFVLIAFVFCEVVNINEFTRTGDLFIFLVGRPSSLPNRS